MLSASLNETLPSFLQRAEKRHAFKIAGTKILMFKQDHVDDHVIIFNCFVNTFEYQSHSNYSGSNRKGLILALIAQWLNHRLMDW